MSGRPPATAPGKGGGLTNRNRVFFPDEDEMKAATRGIAANPGIGRTGVDALFASAKYKLDYLTRPTILLDLGIDILKEPVGARVEATDEVYVAAYPSFNVNEILAVEELYAREDCRPIIVVNGEFERLRSGYYPSVFYPKIAKCSKNFIPLFETAYYIRNFKGSRPGVVFRCYPGPWQVFRRDPGNSDALTCLLTQDEPISVRDAALMLQGR